MFDFSELAAPIVQAPMAGGPSTPALAAAVSDAGGLGFLAAGYQSAAALREDIAAVRELTTTPFGVNVFVPQKSVADQAQLDAYRVELAGEAERYGVEPGATEDDGDDWAPTIDVLEETAPAVVSFTFGLPSADVVDRLHRVDALLVFTVTTTEEAVLAVAGGADVLCVQGPEAGGHRGTFDATADPATQPLDELLGSVRAAVTVPIVAAGGIGGQRDVARMLALGAVAAQLGTGFLLSPEAGTRQAHRDALVSPSFPDTTVTRAFSGRYARALVNRFVREHDATAPLGYPEVHQMTSPLRAAASRRGDPDGVNLWAGTAHASAATLPAGEIVRRLTPDRHRPLTRSV